MVMRLGNRLVRLSHEGNCNKPSTLWEDICKQIRPQRREFKASEPRILNAVAVDEVHHTDALSPRRISVIEYFNRKTIFTTEQINKDIC